MLTLESLKLFPMINFIIYRHTKTLYTDIHIVLLLSYSCKIHFLDSVFVSNTWKNAARDIQKMLRVVRETGINDINEMEVKVHEMADLLSAQDEKMLMYVIMHDSGILIIVDILSIIFIFVDS